MAWSPCQAGRLPSTCNQREVYQSPACIHKADSISTRTRRSRRARSGRRCSGPCRDRCQCSIRRFPWHLSPPHSPEIDSHELRLRLRLQLRLRLRLRLRLWLWLEEAASGRACSPSLAPGMIRSRPRSTRLLPPLPDPASRNHICYPPRSPGETRNLSEMSLEIKHRSPIACVCLQYVRNTTGASRSRARARSRCDC